MGWLACTSEEEIGGFSRVLVVSWAREGECAREKKRVDWVDGCLHQTRPGVSWGDRPCHEYSCSAPLPNTTYTSPICFFQILNKATLATLMGTMKPHVDINTIFHTTVYMFIQNIAISSTFYNFGGFLAISSMRKPEIFIWVFCILFLEQFGENTNLKTLSTCLLDELTR